MIIRFILLLVMSPVLLSGQEYTTYQNCHSHNDYMRDMPFYEAAISGFASIEADVFLVDGELYVAHDRKDIRPERTLRRMYLDPIQREMALGRGSCYSNGRSPQLLIDLKTDYRTTLPALEKLLLEYKECFDTKANPSVVKVVVSGSMPSPDNFAEYSDIIFFDGRPDVAYNADQIKRVAMISTAFGDFSRWNGRGELPSEDRKNIDAYIKAGHNRGIPVRFWGCPDTQEAWKCFMDMGLDFINTDRPRELADFVNLKMNINLIYKK